MLHDTSIKRGDPVLRKRIREIARSRVRYGARRRGVLLRREGWVVNHKRVRRMYREEGLAIRTKSPKGRRPARVREVGVLRRLVAERGKPQRITCDNGPEFVSLQLDQWAYWTSPSTTGRDKNCSIRTGSSVGVLDESFNNRARQELLNPHWFRSLSDAHVQAAAWRRDYNANHPHSALGNLAPEEFARRAENTPPVSAISIGHAE